MSSRHDEPHDDRADFDQARAEFLASVAGRVEGLSEALRALQERPESQRRRDNFLRRAHALGAAARVLGFEGLADQLGDIERDLRSVRGAPASERLAHVEQSLAALPGLARGAPSFDGAGSEPADEPPPMHTIGPATVLVFGTQAFVRALRAEDTGRIEIARAEDLPTARDLAQSIGPDLAIVDGDLRGARELAKALVGGALNDPVAVVVAGNFDTPDAASEFVEMGVARVLSKPVSPDSLGRIVGSVLARPPERFGTEPIGEVAMADLSERIAAEVRRGLVQALEPGCEDRKAPLGNGTDVLAAVWGALARVRELVTVTSGGAIRFDPRGPEGAFTLAPWVGRDRIASDRKAGPYRGAEGVSLEGRRAVVVDDDPAVVWFIGGLLSGVGFEVLEAHDGERAFQLICSTWPDVVVSDVLMPGRDGFTLCRDIKQDVAVRDIPVILLSWKEDLLRRVRELGAEADGYLQKEAPASAVVARVREVLLPRSRVEARLAKQGQARGRLDGLTPRLLLQLACARDSNARIAIRDAVYAYEVEIRNGRLQCATRTDAQGRFLRGERALAGLLGVGSGRFVVSPAQEACRNEFEGDLETVLGPPIRAARAAARALADEELPQVARIEFDADAVAAYAAVLPDPAKAVAERLLAGTLPRELVGSGKQSTRLLRAVLADLARHGGIREVESDDGDDLLERFAVEPEPSAALPADTAATRTPSPWFSLQLSPGPTEQAELSGPEPKPEQAPHPFEEQPASPDPSPQPLRAEVPPVAPNEPGERVSLLDGGWDEAGVPVVPADAADIANRVTLPGVGAARSAERSGAAAATRAVVQPGDADAEPSSAEYEAPRDGTHAAEQAEPVDAQWGEPDRMAAAPPPPASGETSVPEPGPRLEPEAERDAASGAAEPPLETGFGRDQPTERGAASEAKADDATGAEPAEREVTELAEALLGAMADGHAFYPDSQLQPKPGVVRPAEQPEVADAASDDVRPPDAGAPPKATDEPAPVEVESEPLQVRRVARPPRPDSNVVAPASSSDTAQGAADQLPTSAPALTWALDEPDARSANQESSSERHDEAVEPAPAQPPPPDAGAGPPVPPQAPSPDASAAEQEDAGPGRPSGPDLTWALDEPGAPSTSEGSAPQASADASPAAESPSAKPPADESADASPSAEVPAAESPSAESPPEDSADAPVPAQESSTQSSSEESPVSQSALAAPETATSASAAPLPVTKRIAFPAAPQAAGASEHASEAAVETPATKHIAFPTRTTAARSEALDEIESSDAPAVQRSGPPPSRAEPRAGRDGSSNALLSAARTAGLTVVAAAASFALVSMVRGWLGPGDEDQVQAAASAEVAGEIAAPAAVGSAPAPALAGSAAVPGSAAKDVERKFKTEDLPLPPGIVVSAARGMLEVDTAGRHSIYVGGTFVGRGPVRRIELDPGPHSVVTRLGAEELEHEVTVTKGRRIRLSLAPTK
jgi:DNA-binding response OmpR family regulator